MLFDCDDTDPTHHPRVAEVGGNNVDENCDGALLCAVDGDGDGWARTGLVAATACPTGFVGEGDCDDTNPAVSPGQVDDPTRWGDANCDGIFRCGQDLDGDGQDGPPSVLSATPCARYALDCDDLDPTVRAYTVDAVGDDVDQDCDGGFACLVDLDGDGWSAAADGQALPCSAAPPPAPAGDCDDARAQIHPGRPEIAGNGPDDDCDGFAAQYQDLDHDGFGAEVVQEVFYGGWFRTFGGDCDDTNRDVAPGLPDASGDALDADCDGVDPFHVEVAGPRTLVVRGVPARGRWWLAASRVGGGPCTSVAPGLCVDLVAPVLIGAGAGSRGVVVAIPPGVSGQVQALAQVDGAVWRTEVVAVP